MMETARLHLRQWREKDMIPFASLNADPRVMEFYPALLKKEESDAMVQRLYKSITENGWGLWAVEKKDDRDFIGYVGLSRPSFDAHFTPCVEVGWRLKYEVWGRGFAPEAGRECLRFGFQELILPEIVSFTAKINTRSIRVMEKLGMEHSEEDDFEHPKVDKSSPLLHHVLYRAKFTDYEY
jgi:3-dehydroquinate dehydratase/shikimate dehydrogenase